MGLFDGYFDQDQFQDGGGLLGRLLSLQQEQGQYQPGTGFDQAPFAAQTPLTPSTPSPMLPNNLPPSAVPPMGAQDLKSQYAALLPILGDPNAMIATINPETGKTLIAQALANQQQSGILGGASSAGYQQLVISDASPDPVRPGSKYAQPAMGLCAAGPAGCAVGAGLTAGQAILGGTVLGGGLGAIILHNEKQDPPQVPPLPERLIGNNARPGGGRSNTDMPGVDPTPDELFDRLTGGHSDILPDGTRQSPNGIRLRPDTGQGPRIDIPANGEKEHETIHFPGSNQ
jgi:hypothetical protein